MIARLYTNNSDDRVLTKSIVLRDTTNVILKNDTELVNPVIVLSPSTTQNFNYVYLEDFDRYYYVTSRTYSQQRYIVELKCDVLMSFVDEIKNLKVIANRSSSRFNLYQTDGEISFLNRNTIYTEQFPNGFNGLSMILAVNGGNSSNT